MKKNNERAGDNKGKAIKLAGCIGYSKDSVISKTLLDKGTGTLTLFAFDKGQGLSEHTAPFDATVFVAEGEASITIGGKKKIVKKGELVIMPAGVTHSLKAEKRFKMMLIMIRK
ncbi:MAG TPA: cupin domain-containing protein [Candidatus Omnitrophota bacterium]|nr:cupin domain-containing protein [Candidatus Omnitrophota bacterium]HPS19957.1 cupin domain-containing protein [Candidatus Omnitrophota bacterium]